MAKTRYDIDGIETMMGGGRTSFEDDIGETKFCNVAAAIIGGAVVGGAISSRGASNAAETQAEAARDASGTSLQATRETNALQAAMYQQNLVNQSPWLRSGNVALAALTGGLGLGSTYQNQAAQGGNGRVTIPRTPDRATALGVPSNSVPVSPTMSVVPDGRGGYRPTNGRPMIMASEVPDSGRMTAQMSNPRAGISEDSRWQTMVGNVVNNQPAPTTTPTGTGLIPDSALGVQNYGASAQEMAAAANQYAGADGSGIFTDTFTPSDLYTDPSYQFRLNEGRRALEASAAARGMTGSGQNLKDITNYGQSAASQEYGAAYDRFMNNQSTLYNRLAGLAGVGQTTAGTLGAAAQNTAANIGSNTMAGIGASNAALIGGANASAAGQVGSANAWGNAIGSGINNYMGWQYLQGRTPPPTQTGGATSLAGQL